MHFHSDFSSLSAQLVRGETNEQLIEGASESKR